MAEWPAGFAAYSARFAGRFTRVESRRQMALYLWGLLGETERKNGCRLAEAAGVKAGRRRAAIAKALPPRTSAGSVMTCGR